MIPSNQGWYAFTKQTAKGSPVAAPTYKAPYSGGSRLAAPNNTAQLAETDANVWEGNTYKVKGGSAGAPESYLRDSYAHLLLEAALGARASTGTTNYIHTITPASVASYWTVHQMLGGILFEQSEDVFVNTLNVKAQAGQPATIALDSIGVDQKGLVADPAAAVNLAADAPYTFNDIAVTLSGSLSHLVHSFDLTYSNSVTDIQTDGFVPNDVYAGTRSLQVAFDMYFTDLHEYNLFFFGVDPITSPQAQSSAVRVTSLDLVLSHGTNNSIEFNMPQIALEAFPVDPAPNGQPISVAVRGRAQRGTPLTATVKNQVA